MRFLKNSSDCHLEVSISVLNQNKRICFIFGKAFFFFFFLKNGFCLVSKAGYIHFLGTNIRNQVLWASEEKKLEHQMAHGIDENIGEIGSGYKYLRTKESFAVDNRCRSWHRAPCLGNHCSQWTQALLPPLLWMVVTGSHHSPPELGLIKLPCH